MDSFQQNSRETSVIRHTSTPDQTSQDCNLSFGLEERQEETPGFRVYLDHPSEFYSVNLPANHTTPIVSTDQSELSVFEDMAPSGGVNENLPPGALAQPGVKSGLDAKVMKLTRYTSIYDPQKYDANVLRDNKKEWTGHINQCFDAIVDYVAVINNKPEYNENDAAIVDTVMTEAEDKIHQFLIEFNRKCVVTALPPASVPVVPAPGSNTSASSSLSSNTEDKAKIAQVEVNIDTERVSSGVKSLNDEIRRTRDWTNAPSHEVELAMTKIATWKDQFNKLKEKIWNIKRNVQCYDLDATSLTSSEAAVNTLEAEMTLVIDNIEHEDNVRCLYTLNKSKTSNIKYPTFGGSNDEDYLKFQREMKNAFRVNRVRLEDQVQQLRNNLKGCAQKLIPTTLESIDEAFSVLTSIYGDPSRVMASRKSKISSMGNFPSSKVKTAANVKCQVEYLLSLELCIKDIFDVAEMSEDMDREAFNPSTYKTLINLFPLEVHSELCSVAGSIKVQTEALFKYVTDKREELQKILKHLPDAPNNDNGSRSRRDKDRQFTPNANATFKPPARYEKCRICVTLDAEGKTDQIYDGHTNDIPAGCPVYAAMTTQERKKYATKAKLCIFCLDGDYVWKGGNSRHTNCIAFNKRCYFTCNASSCKKHFLICVDHVHLNQEKIDRCKQFWQAKGKQFSATAVMSSAPRKQSSKSPSKSSKRVTDGSRSDVPDVTVSVDNTETAVGDNNDAPEVVAAACDPCIDQATEKLISVAGPDVIVHGVPDGDPLFMFSHAVGKTRGVNVFYDSGCSHMMLKESIPGVELDAVMIRKGPLNISAAGGVTVPVNHEWAVTMVRSDGSRQIMVGVSADNLTANFPTVNTADAYNEILNNVPRHKRARVSQLKVPREAGGQIDVMLGIQYQSCHPEIVHRLPSGLFIAKLKLKSHDGVGGPHRTFSALLGQCGDMSRLMATFIAGIETYRKVGAPKIAGPIMTLEDYDHAESYNRAEIESITGNVPDDHPEDMINVNDDVEDVSTVSTAGFTMQCSSCGSDVEEDVIDLLDAVKDDIGDDKVRAIAAYSDSDDKLSDLKTLIKIMEQGISLEYRCSKCRDCWKCKTASDTERISVREEQEDEMIKDAVKIDFINKKITASLPMRGDPEKYLAPNRNIAEKVLISQCKKVQNDEEAKQCVIKSFQKLTTNGYAVEFSKLTPEQQQKIQSKVPQHYLPWRVVHKPGSISTPTRCTMDASSKTPVLDNGVGGRCLNDICVKGRVNTLNLINMIIKFIMNVKGFCGDLKQFYNRIGLTEDQWHLQRVLFKDDLDIDAETKELIIVTLIYGVKSVSALSERAVLDLAQSVSNINPRLEALLVSGRYVDDIADSEKDDDAVKDIIENANNLFHSAGLDCKGWSMSGFDPHPDVTSDGISVDVAGIAWYPKIDSVIIKIPPLHFGRKFRGKLQVGTEIFDGTFAELDKFVPEALTRRMVTSKLAAVWDPLGKLLPVTSVMKCHLRRVVIETDGWNDAVKIDTRKLWIRNLWRLHTLQGIQYNRAVIPEDAVNTELQLIAAVDAAEVKIAGVWGRFLRRNGQYSCQLIIGRSLLAPVD